MDFDAVLLAPRRAQMVAQGYWPDRTINDALDSCVAVCPEKTALVAHRMDGGATTRLSYRELARLADRVGVGLSRLGVGRNDVVSVQLPNWWQFTVLALACARIGAVVNPLMHIFRERELSFMLAHGESKVIVAPKQFRGFDFEGMLTDLQPKLPGLRHVIAVGGAGANSFETRLAEPAWEREPDAAAILHANRLGPDEVMQLIYTSGTTGEPKGVMHSANTILSNIGPYAERMQLSGDDVVLMASPLAHQTGFIYGLMMPIVLQARAVLQDVWDPRAAVALVRDEGVSFTMASTPFLTDLAQAVADSSQAVPTLRSFLCAGAPIPGPLVERAQRALGAKVISAWGMTENGAVTTTLPKDADERAINTDGRPLPGVELRVLDADGTPLPAGSIGRLQVRSCSNFGGYLKRPQLNDSDAEGWFETGDLARLDDAGYVRITGRSKDVIIRGGENIPVVEIEALLYRHPAVAQAAIVAYPDERLGERACAVVVTKPDRTLDFAALVAFLKQQKLAVQYIPERLVLLEAMPTMPSGKIQKFKLRETVRTANP
jgi:cyclohexanecarboxylate-CoA ligase